MEFQGMLLSPNFGFVPVYRKGYLSHLIRGFWDIFPGLIAVHGYLPLHCGKGLTKDAYLGKDPHGINPGTNPDHKN
jgi:hypothetical protein